MKLQLLEKAWFIPAFLLYPMFFIIRLPLPDSPLFDNLLLLALGCVILITLLKNGFAWRAAGLFLTLAVFTLPLLRLWQSAGGSYYNVLGLLPWSDARSYYNDASRLFDGNLLGPISGHRPLFPGFLASLLGLSGNLQITIVLMTCMVAFAIYLLALALRDNGHPQAGAVIVVVTQFYYCHNTLGTTMTEQLGLSLGAVALAATLSGAATKKIWSYALGLMLLTFALLARAGAFFVLPALIGFGLVQFGKTSKQWMKLGTLLSLCVLIPWLVNTTLNRLITAEPSVAMGNFSYTLYGQVAGGRGWTQVLADHPEITQMGETERTNAIYRFAFEILKRNPAGIGLGTLRAWVEFLLPGEAAAFGFVRLGQDQLNLTLQTILTALMLSGIALCWLNRKDTLCGFLLAGFVGFFLSLPFAPPIDGLGMRAHAAAILFIFALAGSALSIPLRSKPPHLPSFSTQNISLAFGFLLVSMATIGPVLILAFSTPLQLETVSCSPGNQGILFRLQKGAYVSIEKGGQVAFPTISMETYRNSMNNFPAGYADFVQALDQVQPPAILIQTPDLQTGESLFIIASPELAQMEGRVVAACVLKTELPYAVTYLHKFKPVSK